MADAPTLGAEFAKALAAKDFDRVEADDVIEGLDAVETDSFADRTRVGYRFHGHNPDGPFVVEQQAYVAERDGRIGWMRVLCSGFRPRSG